MILKTRFEAVHLRIVVILLTVLMESTVCFADLNFRLDVTNNGMKVLWVDDLICESSNSAEMNLRNSNGQCKYPNNSGKKGFGKQDGSRFESAIRSFQGQFSEVWFRSDGGDLEAGKEIGRILRRYGLRVRVPGGAACISSCTVAFLGGDVRQVDHDATYQMHMFSAARGALDNEIKKRGLESVINYGILEKGVQFDCQPVFEHVLKESVSLISYFYEIKGGDSQASEIKALEKADYDKHRCSNLQRMTEDVAGIQRGGFAVMHNYYLGLELEAGKQVLDAATKLSASGSNLKFRKTVALFNAMHASSIDRTFTLTRPQLKSLGIDNVVEGL